MGARVSKPRERWHTFRLVDGKAELILVGKGGHAYLWTGPNDGTCVGCTTFSGQQSLRKLARAILRTVPARKHSSRRTS